MVAIRDTITLLDGQLRSLVTRHGEVIAVPYNGSASATVAGLVASLREAEVGLFNGELYEKHRILTSADIQRNYMDHVRSCGLLSRYPDIPKEFELSAS